MKTNETKQEIKVLTNPQFNREEAQKKINEAMTLLKENINTLNNIAEKNKIYITIDETREREKIITSLFPFMYNESFSYSNFYGKNGEEKLLNTLERAYNNRMNQALNEIRFISLNEKTKVIKCRKDYYLHLHPLNQVATFENNINSTNDAVDIIKEYANGNIEFKFKSNIDYETFKAIVYHHTPSTQEIINKATDEEIKKYLEAKKKKHINEYYFIHEIKERLGLKPYDSINYNLINKAWGVIK